MAVSLPLPLAAFALGFLVPVAFIVPKVPAKRAVPTVPGPEVDDLLAGARGLIVLDDPVGGIGTFRLPDLGYATPRKPDLGLLTVHSVAGPDARGRIAFIENDVLGKRHALALIRADGGGAEVIFEGRGDALWEHAAGEHLALDAAGERVALVARSAGLKLRNPDAILRIGELEVWSIPERARVSARTRALDDVLAWFPDGKRLAYTTLLEQSEAEQLLRSHVQAGDAFARRTIFWEWVPVVHVLDVESGESRALHVGERPLVSPDGRLLLLCDSELLRWRVLDLETNESRPFEAPGAISPGPIAFVDASLVLYWARPTEGEEPRLAEHTSPSKAKKRMRALKLVDLRDGRFQTALPYVDPRRRISFGSWSPDES